MLEQIIEINQRLARIEAQLAGLVGSNTIYLGDHEALTRLYTGHRIYLDTRDVGIASHIMLEGRWEPWVETAIAQLVKPGMHVVDAGANFGYYTLLMAQWVGAGGRVDSFEANPSICQKLRKSIAMNGFSGHVRLHEVAVMDREGTAEFTFTHEFSGGGAVGAGRDAHWTNETTTVTVKPMDAVLADVPRVDFIKLDVEGGEPAALRGAMGVIERSPSLAMIVEFHAPAFARARDPAEAFLQRWEGMGFRISLVEPDGVSPALPAAEIARRAGNRLTYLQLVRGG